MIYTLTLNPSLDYIVTVPEFACGRVNRTTEEKIFPGGKGVNVSIVLKNLGLENTALGFCAGFTGDKFRELMEEKGIRTDFIPLAEGMTRINVKLRAGEETEINGRGPAIGEEDIEKLYEKTGRLTEGDVLVLAGSIPSAMPRSIYRDIMERLKGKRLKVAVDAAGELLLSVLSCRPFLIKPNRHELEEIFQASITERGEAIRYAEKLREMGAQNVLVSLAGEGAVLAAEDGGAYEAEAPEGTVKNSVGAGDSMVAGFLAGYLQTGNCGEAFQMGLCAGSASAFSEELAAAEEIAALWEQCSKTGYIEQRTDPERQKGWEAYGIAGEKCIRRDCYRKISDI